MKRYITNWLMLALFAMVTTTFFSCEKDENGGSSASSNPKIDKIDPERGASNEVLTITGSGIGGMTSIVFEQDSVAAPFNPNFNTDHALIFRIPEAAVPGQQNIIFRNSKGVEIKVPFMVLGLPRITESSQYSFTDGTEVTLTGKNLDDVTKVAYAGTTDALSIISKSATSLKIKMKGTTLNSVKFAITNEAGTITTTQELINLDHAYSFFTEGFDNGWENGSWGAAEVSSDFARSGSKSFKVTYAKGNWSANGFASWSKGLDYTDEYKYLSFWVKGGPADYTFYITGDQREGGYGNADRSYPIVIPKEVWTYFKIKLSDLQLWKKGTNFKQLGFWIPGPDDQDVSLYFDDVLLIRE